jgi:hypothetical protein
VLELLQGLLTSREVLWPLEPRLSLSLLYKNEHGSTIEGSTSLSSHLLQGGVGGYL